MADDDGDRHGLEDDGYGDHLDDRGRDTDVPPRGGPATGSGRFADSHDGYDDDDYDDDYDDDRFDQRHETKRRPDTWVVGVAALIVVAAVLFIVLRGDSKKSTTKGGGTDSSAQTTSGDKTQKVWANDSVNHPPRGLDGTGKPDGTTPSTAPGVYFWSSYDGWHVAVIRGAGVSAVKVEVKNDAPANTEPTHAVMQTGTTPGVTATQVAPGDLILDVAAGTENTVVNLNIGPYNDQLTWSFDGVAANLVHSGSSVAPIQASPVTINKQVAK